jgi:ubiquitin-protein ligase
VNDPAQSESTILLRSNREEYNRRVKEQTRRFVPKPPEADVVIE